MVAVFAPLQRPREGRVEIDLPVGTRDEVRALADRDRDMAAIRKVVGELRKRTEADVLADERSSLPGEVREAFRARPFKRSPRQNRLVEENRSRLDREVSDALPEEDRVAIGWLDGEVRLLRERSPDLPRGYFLRETSQDPPTTHLLSRGQATSPGPEVGPGVPAVLVAVQPQFPAPDGRTTRRRLTLARWLASPDHPLTARVIVNRVWQFHFGEGLVRTPSDFGVGGVPPTHPELLDWLADWFTHEGGWSIKALNRLILTSQASRMGKRSRSDYAAEDSEDRALWRLPYKRLEVEALRDAILSASGRLNPAMYGPSVYPAVPKGPSKATATPTRSGGHRPKGRPRDARSTPS